MLVTFAWVRGKGGLQGFEFSRESETLNAPIEKEPTHDARHSKGLCALALSCASLSAERLKPTTRVPDTLRDVPNKVGVLRDYKRGSNGTRVAYCTASVIASDFILTAADCVVDEAGEARKGVIFAPGNPHTGTLGRVFSRSKRSIHARAAGHFDGYRHG
ncbi:hypothetical protein SAMN04488093_102390 [Tropicibacter naphthalenivorans]|uniref:V8-like Glu-specific endopeptidase n=1 Tax=Tropicibacter naphthalenivorans TaxID=441103 RepID=A0A0P1GNX5_9RHOB|nr:V8-like Glu-specific endopeptidase [Tropicibacter naphthalenivorans]SMC61837.1 hypothetical protein SAMN04488093_102390 [Tropicibacter naphthalenivorans]